MPYAANQELRIHYRVIGDGPPLVLHHGFSDSLVGWFTSGWVARLTPRFRLIMLDARGHGQSGKPNDPRHYLLEQRVADVLAVADAAGAPRFHYLGYSLGGWVGLGLAAQATGRLLSVSLGGTHPYGQDMEPYRQGIAAGLHGWVDFLYSAAGPLLPEHARPRFLANDVTALAASVADDRPPLPDLSWGQRVPSLLFAGTADPLFAQVARLATELPAREFVPIRGANHVQAILSPGALALRLIQFLTAVRDTDAPRYGSDDDEDSPPHSPAE